MLKKIVLSLFILIVCLILFIVFRVNREDLSFVSKYPSINANDIKLHNDRIAVIIFSTGCSGVEHTTPKLSENLKYFKRNSIPYLLIADELYIDQLDKDVDLFKRTYGLTKEKFYIFDRNTYKKNAGIFNIKGRYKEFISDLCGITKDFPFGYVNYITFKKNQCISFEPEIDTNKYHIEFFR